MLQANIETFGKNDAIIDDDRCVERSAKLLMVLEAESMASIVRMVTMVPSGTVTVMGWGGGGGGGGAGVPLAREWARASAVLVSLPWTWLA